MLFVIQTSNCGLLSETLESRWKKKSNEGQKKGYNYFQQWSLTLLLSCHKFPFPVSLKTGSEGAFTVLLCWMAEAYGYSLSEEIGV